MISDMHHVSGKGILVKEGRILLIKYFEEEVGVHYNIPGGQQHPNETIIETVKRKMHEEAGALVQVERFMFMYEYIGKNHSNSMGDKHSVSLIFECALSPGSQPSMAKCTAPDILRQIGVCWVPFAELEEVLLFPHMARQIVTAVTSLDMLPDRYIGDID